jgi:hypothetical protein
MYQYPTILLAIVIWQMIFSDPSPVSGKIGFISTVDNTNNSNSLANLTAEAQISPYS